MTNHKLKMWWETARPKTLPLALASIFTGSALAYWADKESFNLTVMLLCLLTTILLQVLSNFANDYGDHQKGSDTEERIGPLRGIQQGAISANELKWGLILMAVGSFFSGAFLIGIAYQNLTDLLAFAGLGILAIIMAVVLYYLTVVPQIIVAIPHLIIAEFNVTSTNDLSSTKG